MGKAKLTLRVRMNELAENTAKRESNAYWPLPVEIVLFRFITNYFDKPRPEQQ
jgi:hypothetical protein